jgi:hypothetical protein
MFGYSQDKYKHHFYAIYLKNEYKVMAIKKIILILTK